MDCISLTFSLCHLVDLPKLTGFFPVSNAALVGVPVGDT